MEDTRRFTRLPAAINARFLPVEQTEHKATCAIDGEIQDISLKGVLMLCVSQAIPDSQLNSEGTLNLELNYGELTLSMTVRVAHLEDNFAGLEFLEMDIDAISHVRRLIELNLGSDQTLQRELAMLWDNRN